MDLTNLKKLKEFFRNLTPEQAWAAGKLLTVAGFGQACEPEIAQIIVSELVNRATFGALTDPENAYAMTDLSRQLLDIYKEKIAPEVPQQPEKARVFCNRFVPEKVENVRDTFRAYAIIEDQKLIDALHRCNEVVVIDKVEDWNNSLNEAVLWSEGWRLPLADEARTLLESGILHVGRCWVEECEVDDDGFEASPHEAFVAVLGGNRSEPDEVCIIRYDKDNTAPLVLIREMRPNNDLLAEITRSRKGDKDDEN